MGPTRRAGGDRRRHNKHVTRRQRDLGWRRTCLTSCQAKQGGRGEAGKVSRPPLRRSRASFPQPVGESHQVHGRRIDRLLQVGFGQTDIAAAPQIETTHPLGNRAFSPRSQGVLRLELLGLLPLTGGLQRLVLRLRSHRQLPRKDLLKIVLECQEDDF